MIQLEKTFVRYGFRHTLQHREKDIALYKRVSVDLRTLEVEIDPLIDFEVIIIQHQEANIITVGDTSFDVIEKEVYPKGRDWGAFGFSFSEYSEAKEQYDKLITEEKRNT